MPLPKLSCDQFATGAVALTVPSGAISAANVKRFDDLESYEINTNPATNSLNLPTEAM